MQYHDALKAYERATGLPLSTLLPHEEQLAANLPAIPDIMRSLIASVNTRVAETFYTDLRDRVARMFGVLSLAEVPDSLLMWAHYSSEHRGAVIGFDKDQPFFDRRLHDQDIAGRVRPVAYSEARPRRAIVNEPQDEAQFMKELAHDFFLVKSPEWAYEREWRMILPAANAIEVVKDGTQEVLLYDFPAEAVREVILGCRASEATTSEVRSVLGRPEYRHVALRRARLHKELFQLVFEPETIGTSG